MVRSAGRIVPEPDYETPPRVPEGVVDLTLDKRVALGLPEPDPRQLSADVGHVGGVSQGSPPIDVDEAVGGVLGLVKDVVDPVVDAGLVPWVTKYFTDQLTGKVIGKKSACASDIQLPIYP